MNATNSSKESSDKSQESCGKKTKCAVSGNRHDMDSSMGGNREAAGGGMVAEENHQVVNANATMQKDKSSTTKMKPRLNYHSNIIIRKRKVNEYSTLSKQEKASKSKRKKDRCQAEDEMANKDAKQNKRKKRKTNDLAVPAGIDVSDLIHHEANMDDGTDMHTMNTKEKSNHEKWIRLFMELVDYKEKNGHCNVPRRNGSLGSWISTQRTLFGYKELKADRYEKLVGIGFVFEDARCDNEKWNRFFVELEKYKGKNGHCNVPRKNGSFGSWISRQRTLFTSKRLKADRYEKLVGIGLIFDDAKFPSNNVKWNTRFIELEKYKEKNGHCNVPRKNGSFGIWINTQRTLFRSKELKEDRYEKLVGIGVVFEDVKFASENVKWNTRFMELEKYKEKNGHCNCPTKNGSLGIWILRQRTLFRTKKLKADRYEKLVGIGFA
eukprot:scaffold1174_cov281-Chaetoceros_neogracile.AAC.21